ncbi:rhomboid family intramembrane serine protease [Amycolatopsis acidicola]|uniref:Rhomboid family intramembrane serine protease n=1 Tax=Amycolatopsis acidicola TaxID=2596893 RepID=A0A5N0VKN2_9PSEU|nr:rhomboid family intramembrane serine protease [Amycolatopsis acidicola]KAA9166726.1 rhomboid family intramembrane serine protease [Amycolatopsis acidicola]
MTQPPHPQTPPTSALPGCWWHPTRQTGLSCVRCGRPACPDCLREASVGAQCIDCVQAGRKQERAQQRSRPIPAGARTVAGAKLSTNLAVTPTLIALNVLVYVFTAFQAKSVMDNDTATVFRDWVLWPRAVAGESEWWRLFTSGFLHYGLLHIAVNMFSLWILGRDMEILLGKVRFAAVYLLSLFGGGVSVYLFDDSNRATAGASGAIYGLLGGILIAVIRLRLNPAAAIGTIVLNIVISVSVPNISLLGHFGGFVVGALVTAAMVYAPAKNRVAWQSAAVAVVLVALVALVFYGNAQLAGVTCQYVQGQLGCTPPSG